MSRAERVAARREYLKDVAEQIGSAGQAILDYRLEKAEIKAGKSEVRQEEKTDRTEAKADAGYYDPASIEARWAGYAALAQAGVDIGAMIATGGASGAIPDFSFGGSAEDGGYSVNDILDMIPSGNSGTTYEPSGTQATATQGGERRTDTSALGIVAALGAGLLLLK
jgi:hypothetical protein